MLKEERELILKNLTIYMSDLNTQILDCDNAISETTEKKLVAQAQGDLSENIEYQTAVEKLAQLNQKLVNLTNRRDSWNSFSAARNDVAAEYVGEGSCIVLENRARRRFTLLLVPALLGMAELNSITVESPVGKAALGKVKGDVLEVITPSGHIQYTIIDIY